MKRQKINLAAIASYKNLVLAFHKAAKGKRYRQEVQDFMAQFDHNIFQLSQDILNDKMPYGRFRAFYIYDPKKRLIHAACFEDRIFHHAVMNIAGETLERAMSPTSYACRPNKGVHKAARQVQQNLQKYSHYVKIDILGYFAMIHHGHLLKVLQRRFKGKGFFQQLERIINSYQAEEGIGLPIGSLTSQYFANYYLDGLDRYLENQQAVKAYVRYMDDIIWWCESVKSARATLNAVHHWLLQERALTIKPNVQVQPSKQGVTYCGFRLTQGAVRLTRRRKRRFQQRRQYWEGLYQKGVIDELQLQTVYASVHAITANTDSKGWRQENLKRHPALTI